MLALLLSFNSITCYVYAEDFSGSSTDYNIPSKDTLKELPVDAPQATENFLKNVYFQPMTEFFNGLGIDIWGDNKVWNEDTSKFILENASKDNNVTTDGNYYYISANFINNINQKVQDNIHALDGYYLFEPNASLTYDNFVSYRQSFGSDINDSNTEYQFSRFNDNISDLVYYFDCDYLKTMVPNFGLDIYNKPDSSKLFFIEDGYVKYLSTADGSTSSVLRVRQGSSSSPYLCTSSQNIYFGNFSYAFKHGFVLGDSPFKVFYSKQDAKNFFSKGRQYYAPRLPFSNIRIPVTYINNTNELPDFDFNFDKLIGKTENEIQTNIDATLKAYLDHLVKLNNTSSKPTPTVPAVRVTPTPDIGDRPTAPSPTPPVTDDTSSTDKLLEQIYDWLLDFGDKHETFVMI